MAERDRDRRETPRSETFFVAVEHEGDDVYYRVVTSMSQGGFRFEDPTAVHDVGDEVELEFPLPRGETFRVRGEVARAIGRAAGREVGVRIKHAPARHLELLLAGLPRR